jgi:hypothetical protein
LGGSVVNSHSGLGKEESPEAIEPTPKYRIEKPTFHHDDNYDDDDDNDN